MNFLMADDADIAQWTCDIEPCDTVCRDDSVGGKHANHSIKVGLSHDLPIEICIDSHHRKYHTAFL